MEIAKAIEILDQLAKPIIPYGNPDLPDALKLGIEALRQVQQRQDRFPHLAHLKLPSQIQEVRHDQS